MSEKEFRKIFSQRGKSLRAMGSPEWALSKEDALQAIASLRGSGRAILGGQAVLFDADGRPSYDLTAIWTSPRFDATSSWQSFASRTHNLAENYVSNYRDPEHPESYFAFSTASEEQYRNLPTKKG